MRFELSPNLISQFYHDGFAEIDGLFDEDLSSFFTEGSFESRRDRFRSDAKFKKCFFGSGPTHIAATLTKAAALQIGFDQLYLEDELPKEFRLNEIASLSKIACGMLVVPGNLICFFGPDHPMERPDGKALICCWIFPGCRCAPKTTDPSSHLLRRMGYNAGDVLSSKTHPIVKK